jgi:hypothetical protein
MKLLKRKDYTTYIVNRYLDEINSVEFFDKCKNCRLTKYNDLYCSGAYIGKVQVKLILE